MGCGATTSARHVPDLSKPDTSTASSSSQNPENVPGLAPNGQGASSSTGVAAESDLRSSAKPDESSSKAEKRTASKDNDDPLQKRDSKSSKKSRIAQEVEGAQKWTREECEQLSICHLVRWLEALSKDVAPAVKKDKAIQRLWQEITTNSPPALASVTAVEHLSWWPLQEILRWLEYFNCDSEVADKPMLVRMLLENGEELPPPSFLGETAEQDYLTQVQQHVSTLKTSAHSLLNELAKEIIEVENQLNQEGKAPDHVWTATGLVLADFRGADAQAELRQRSGEDNNVEEEQHYFLDVKAGQRVDLIQRDPSGWSWCIAAEGRESGYVPSASVTDIAHVLTAYGNVGDNNGTLVVKQGEEIEVLVRHYSGWTLCRKSAAAEGWVPDTCLSENSLGKATKQHRLILNGLHALAQDAYGVEASFCKLRAQGTNGNNDNGGNEGDAPVTLEGLYAQVLALIEEYKNICQALEANAAASTARTGTTQETQSPERKKRSSPQANHDLPDWVYVDSKCIWNSVSQNAQLPVTIRKICYQREQVLVVFDNTPTHRKICEFKQFKDEDCPLKPRHPDFKRRKVKKKGQALAAVEKAEEDLEADLRGLVSDLGVDAMQSARLESARQSARQRQSARECGLDSDSDNSDDSSMTTSTAEPPPDPPEGPEALSDPSQHSARFGKDGRDPSDEALAKAAEEEALKKAAEEEALAKAAEKEAAALAEAQRAAAVQIQAFERLRIAGQQALSRLVQVTCRRYVDEAQRAISAAEEEAALKQRKQEAATVIQSRQRGIRDRRHAVDRAVAKQAALEAAAKEAADAAAKAKALAEEEAAILIQASTRGWAARRKMKATKMLRRAVRDTIARWKAYDLLQELLRQKKANEAVAALIIQRNSRGYLGRRKVRARKAEAEEMMRINNQATAAKVIKGVCRGHLMRMEVAKLQLDYDSAKKIQAVARGNHVRRLQGPKLVEFTAKRVAAALVIQAAYRGTRARRQLADELRLKNPPATRIQSVWRGARVRAATKPLIKKRAMSAVCVQRCWRGRMGRLEAMRKLKDRSATLISSAFLTIASMVKLAELREARAKFLAVRRIQTNWRRIQAVKTVAGILHNRRISSAALQIQTNWRGLLGRRQVLDRRVQVANEFLESLLAGQVSFTQKRDTAWLHRVLKALEWKERKEGDKEKQDLEIRRRQEAGRLPQGDDKMALRMKATAAMDRGLAAVAVVRTRTNLRMRAVLLGQVEADAITGCDPAMASAVLVNEGLLARLAPDDATSEIASLLATAWAIAASSGSITNPAQRPKGMPAPYEVLRLSVTALQRRLGAESLGSNAEALEEDPENANETSAAVAQAEERANALLHLALDPMRAEIKAIREAVPAAVQAAKEAAAKVPLEVKAVRDQHAAEAVIEEAKLREEREQKHAQTQALQDIAMLTQMEKERLEGALYNEDGGKKAPKVFALVLENVKKLQQQIKDLEVNGENRKHQGILSHALRALQVRAEKAAGDSKTYAFVHPGEKLIDDDYKPSEQVKKKQAKAEENEREFRVALAAEVETLKRSLEAKTAHAAAEVGATFRKEAEVYGKEAQELAHRLRVWRDAASEARPWLGVLLPLAKANALINRASLQMKKHRGLGNSLGPVVHSILPTVNKLKKDLPLAGAAESPREDDLSSLAASLGEVRQKVAALLKAYPDPEVPSPTGAKELLARHSLDSEEDSHEIVDHFVTPGKLRPGDKINASKLLSPKEGDLSDHDEPGVGKRTSEKTKGLPPRTQSKALSQATGGLSGLASMGNQLNALEAALANATGQAQGSPIPNAPLSKSMPPAMLRASPRPPTSMEPSPRPSTSLTKTAHIGEEPSTQSKPRPTSAVGSRDSRKVAPAPSSSTENRSDKITPALRHAKSSTSLPRQGQQPLDSKVASGTGFKAVQEKRASKHQNAWS